MGQHSVRIRPVDFKALYKIMVCARVHGCELKPWEKAFEEELYVKLARRLAEMKKCEGRGMAKHETC